MALPAQNLVAAASGPHTVILIDTAINAVTEPAFGPARAVPIRPVTPVATRAATVKFDDFYRLEFSSMVALARAICGDHQQAEDLAQEAMSRAHKHWPKVSGYDRPGAWLRRVTINLALSRRKRIQRELTMLRRTAAAQRPPAEDPSPGSDDEVWHAVRSLPPKQRAAIALFYQEDQSTADIAEALGCTVSTATSHLSQARARLANLLNEEAEPVTEEELRMGSGR
ncbi:MAG: RNA polymerase sigma factor [Acidimicrobiales bacterium]